jgi:hypothetical protein
LFDLFIKIESNIDEYKIEKSLWKRYSDFEEFYLIIKQNYPQINLPPMPAKHYFSQFDEGVIREREKAFDQVLIYNKYIIISINIYFIIIFYDSSYL